MGVAREANGEDELDTPLPKTLCLAPAEAKGEAAEEASFEKPEEAKAAAEVSVFLLSVLVEMMAEVSEVVA